MKLKPSVNDNSVYVDNGKQQFSVGNCGVILPGAVIGTSLRPLIIFSDFLNKKNQNLRTLLEASNASPSANREHDDSVALEDIIAIPSTKGSAVFPLIFKPWISIYNQTRPLPTSKHQVNSSNMRIDFRSPTYT